MTSDSLEKRFKEMRKAFREIKPAKMPVGRSIFELKEIKNDLYYVFGKEKIEIDVVAELKISSPEAKKVVEEYRKLKNKQI